jgi:hypothetical protein
MVRIRVFTLKRIRAMTYPASGAADAVVPEARRGGIHIPVSFSHCFILP